jgi:hypothetical protein
MEGSMESYLLFGVLYIGRGLAYVIYYLMMR